MPLKTTIWISRILGIASLLSVWFYFQLRIPFYFGPIFLVANTFFLNWYFPKINRPFSLFTSGWAIITIISFLIFNSDSGSFFGYNGGEVMFYIMTIAYGALLLLAELWFSFRPRYLTSY